MTENNENIKKADKYYMSYAIELAKRGRGLVNPNPMVGCVVVAGDASQAAGEDELNKKIITSGWHKAYGEYHAERMALTECDKDVSGATMYVTLEPCCHTGKTPPCTDIIIEKKIARVVVGSSDPNPLVAGGGIRLLREAGVEVITGVMRKECDALNEVFFHYITKKRPYVAMKYAMTLDGHIATVTGDSKWITSETARRHVHGLRRDYMAIMAGINTVLADDPMLNYRPDSDENIKTEADGRYQPIRIIPDSKLSIPIDSNIVKTAKKYKTIIAYTDTDDEEKKSLLEDAGVTLMRLPPDADGHVDIDKLLKKMGDEGIDSVLVEGGAHIHGAFLSANKIDRVYAYIAPKIVGGNALTPVLGDGIELMNNALQLNNTEIIILGDDICITGNTGMS